MREMRASGFGEAVVLAVRPLVGWHHIAVERTVGEQAAEGPVHGCLGDVHQTRGAETPDHVVPVPVTRSQHGENGHVQHTLQQLRLVDRLVVRGHVVSLLCIAQYHKNHSNCVPTVWVQFVHVQRHH